MRDSKDLQVLSRRIIKDIKKGKSRLIIIDELVKTGWDRKEAERFIGSINIYSPEPKLSPEEQKQADSRIKKSLLHGVLLLFFGLIVSFVTHSNTSEGGSYRISYGAMIFGVYYLGKGAYLWFKNRE
ncbi:MAG: hypothetical protein KAR42_04890 [candidate division Zixibacteria bacterium]|nr:hypothetical protein [candidate division Zixibacteria bacterium]